MRISGNIIGNNLLGQEKSKVVNDKGFGNYLNEYIDKINEYEAKTKELEEKAVVGQLDNLHDVMIAAQKSEIAVSFAVEVKNKVMEAYKEIMRLQV